jgi:hypothetical protein
MPNGAASRNALRPAPDLVASRIRVAVKVLKGDDLSSFKRFGQIKILVARIENQVGVVNGNETSVSGARHELDPYIVIKSLDDEVSPALEDSFHVERRYLTLAFALRRSAQ